MRILVVEDDALLREAIVTVFREEGYWVDEADNGDDGLFKAGQNIFDLLVLDIMLPEISGLAIVKKLRRQGLTVPILFLTARDSIEDRVAGLESGADDYLIKPFAVPELLARVKALLRRTASGKEGMLQYGEIALNPKLKDGFVNQNALQLTAKEYELLEFFIVNKEQILAREQIFDRIWGFESETTLGIVDLYVHYLRKKLAPFGYEAVIQTVRGVGFKLKAK
ncbi:MAG: response regulator transcription factor [Veillonellales bacterium]